MQNKSLEWKRVIIYTLLSCLIAWVLWIPMNKIIGFDTWFSSFKYSGLAILGMFAPALANLLTRVLTKEGWKDMYLHLNIKKGNIRYYIIAMFLPIVAGLIGGLVTSLVLDLFDADKMKELYAFRLVFGTALNITAAGCLFAWVTFGEEFGWRAYLAPKLEKLVGSAWSGVISGIIWGLWHAPLTVVGHNFGTDYWGFPYVGIAVMTLICTAEGIILMWFTKKTRSVYPAAIWHGVNNQGGVGIGTIFLTKIDENFKLGISHNILFQTFSIILSIVLFFVMLKEDKKQKQ